MSGGRGEEEEEEGGGGGGRQRSVCRPIIIKVIKVIIIKIHAIVRTHALATGTLAHTGMSECIEYIQDIHSEYILTSEYIQYIHSEYTYVRMYS